MQKKHTREMFLAEIVSSDSLFCAYERETLKTWFRSDSNSTAKRSSDSNSLSETYLDRIWI